MASVYQSIGGLAFPKVAADVTDSLTPVLDPGLDRLLSFFKTSVNSELSAAWTVAATGTSLAGTDPVADTLWKQPTKGALRGQNLAFPLLCLARTSYSSDEETLAEQRITTRWALDYLLGPLSESDHRRLGAVVHAVHAVARLILRDRRHPDFESGAAQFGPDQGGFTTIKIVEATPGQAEVGENGDGLEFWGIHIELETTETDAFVDGTAAPYLGMSLSGDVGDGSNTIPDFLQVKT